MIKHKDTKTLRKHEGLLFVSLYLGGSISAANAVPVVENNWVAQVTSVSELSNVKSTDWAFVALRSLVERYGLLSGLTDATFRGNRTLTRYEFAAVLAQALEQINTLIVNGSQFTQEDFITLQRLEREYSLAVVELGDRLQTIDTRISQLENNQFSPTTKLQGELLLAITGGRDANTTVVNRERLNLVTSFLPGDLLLTQLEFGNFGQDAIAIHNKDQNLLGTTGVLADGGGLEYAEVDSNVRLRRLFYTFRPSSDIAVTIGAKMSPQDFIDRNRYANNEAVDFSSSFLLNNPLIVQNQIDRSGGAGAAVAWNIDGSSFTVRSLYIAVDANQSIRGLFDDRYQGSVEVEYLPNQNLAVRLQYTNAFIDNTKIQAAGINAEYNFNRNTSIFGRFGFGSYQGFNTQIEQDLDLQPRTWALGLALRNFGIPGTLAGVAIGQPFVENDLGNATQTNFEAFYNFQLSDNISITPAVQLVTNADNDRSNGTTWQTTLRTTFNF